jgi:hypothetical protein
LIAAFSMNMQLREIIANTPIGYYKNKDESSLLLWIMKKQWRSFAYF